LGWGLGVVGGVVGVGGGVWLMLMLRVLLLLQWKLRAFHNE